MQTKDLQWKRALRSVLLILLLSAVGMTKSYAVTIGDLNYSLDNNTLTATVTGHKDGKNATGNLTIPSTVTYTSYEWINGQQVPVTRTYTVTMIGLQAFKDCRGLTGSLIIPNSVTRIGWEAFTYCSGFTGNLTIGNSVTTIDSGAFYGCGFTGILTIGNSVTYIGGYSFAYCKFTGDLFIPTSVTTIAVGAFIGCNCFTGDLIISNSVTSIGVQAFRSCNGFTGNLTIGNSVTSIGGEAFRGCSGFTGNLTIPNSVTTIYYEAFRNCSGFTGDLTIPNSVTSIGSSAFQDCSGFSGNLTIGNSVTSLDQCVFWNCNGFTSINSHAETPPSIYTNTFAYVNHNIPVTVPCGSEEAYQSAAFWNEFTNIQENCSVAYIGAFSVSSNGKKVCFSQGNLQYQASTNTWKFAENQWDYVGDANSNIGPDNSGWIDLFGWGTSGYNHGAVCYQPWSTNPSHFDYYVYGCETCDLNDQTGQADWGYNAISNGGGQVNQWHTLTKDEWNYVFNTRSTSSGIRYAKATINGVNGVILLPDDWNNSIYSLSNTNDEGANYDSNILTVSQWETLEQNGAVFLPATGRRWNNMMNNLERGGYWSATHKTDHDVYQLRFDNNSLNAVANDARDNGFSVRLVRPVQDVVTQTINLSEGWNWFSTYLDITLDDLKAALVEALPGTAITIKSQTQNTTYNPNTQRWGGNLTWDVAKMYNIKVAASCEITLVGTPINPAEHPVTIVNGVNWIGFPFSENMSISDVFAGFAANGDKVKSQNSTGQYQGGSWRGNLNALEPGKGYVYISNTQGIRIFIFPINTK